jgi:hypothetical protein
VSLSARDRQALESIETGLSGSDPKLASMLHAFSRLTAGEDMPEPESAHRNVVRAMRIWRTLRVPHRLLLRWSRWHRARLLVCLWLAISLALITVAVVLSRASPGSCASPMPDCAAHTARTEAPGAAVLQRAYAGSGPPGGARPISVSIWIERLMVEP